MQKCTLELFSEFYFILPKQLLKKSLPHPFSALEALRFLVTFESSEYRARISFRKDSVSAGKMCAH